MNSTILIDKLREYNGDEEEFVTKALNYATKLHEGQFRQSGEPYIIHPINVAYILEDMHADKDTICAGLLHDVLEDTDITKEDIRNDFNPDIASLVDGVTKLSKMSFSSKEDQNYANTRKIITGITTDVRIIIIKLADRLHNMRTLQYKSEYKQKENAIETMEIFVPLAYYIGAYKIKTELEDLSLKYLKPDVYNSIKEKRANIELESSECINEVLTKINNILNDKNIPSKIKVRTKNIYGIYKKISSGEKISDIHDLLALKIMVDDIDNCYRALGLVHSIYHPINYKFKDYICNPKTNLYQSLHTTIFAPDDKLIQTQIRTFDMDKVASYGLCAYWDIQKGNARYVMQEDLNKKFQFFTSLNEINSMFKDNYDFVNQVKKELFSDIIHVYTSNGDVIELPNGSTPIDFAYKLDSNIGNTMIGALVNDDYVPVNYILKNKDRVRILTDENSYGSRKEWVDIANTSLAKRKIKELGD